MNDIKNVYLIGLGAIGGIVANKIQEFCPGSLHIVADRQRIGRYLKSGISINEKTTEYDFIQPDEIKEKADLVILAVKQHHLSQAIADVKKLVGPDTILLSLLNGISSEEILGKEFGMDKLLYSFYVATDAVRTGTEIRYTNPGRIVFGDRTDSAASPKVAAVRDFFNKARISYQIPENILREQWWKFMMNVGVNQVSTVLRAPYGVFRENTEARELMFAASREVAALSREIGINLCEDDIQKYAAIIDGLAPEGKTSMLQDMEARRKTEVEIFAGTVVELGQKCGVPTPVNAVLYKMIKAMEQMAQTGPVIHGFH